MMKRTSHAVLSACCAALLIGALPVRAVAWGPPKMAWEDFNEKYQAAGQPGTADHTVTLTGNLSLSGGNYSLGPTREKVVVETPGRYSIVVGGDAVLTIDNPNLTISGKDNLTGALIVSGGWLELKNGAIQTENGPAVLMMSDGAHLITGRGGRVSITAAYQGAGEGFNVRAGIAAAAEWGQALRLSRIDLLVTGGDAAIYAADNVVLHDCKVRAVGGTEGKVVLFVSENRTLTLEGNTTVDPPPEEPAPPIDPLPEPSPGYVVTSVLPGDGASRDREVWCLSGTSPDRLALPAAGIVFYDGLNGGEDGYLEDVPLTWAPGTLPDPLTPGEYVLTGAPDPGKLAVDGTPIQNPGGAAAEVTLTVWAPGPPSRMRVESNPAEGGRLTTYKDLPPLAESGAAAVYAEYSADGCAWRRARVNTRREAEPPLYSENLLEDFHFDGDSRNFTLTVPASGFYTRLNVVGGPFAGVSNTVEHGVLTPPAIEKDDGDGDRGGGGQGEHGRPGKIETEPEVGTAAGAAPVPEERTEAAPWAQGTEPLRQQAVQPVLPPREKAAPDPGPEQMENGGTDYFRGGTSGPVLPAPSPTPVQAAEGDPPEAAVPLGEAAPSEKRETPVDGQLPPPGQEARPETPPARLPGYAAAAGATAALLLCGTVWFRRRGKRT